MAQIQQQQVFVQYVDQYGNPIPVVPMGQQQQPMQVVMPIQQSMQQQQKMSVASASSLRSNSYPSAPPPGQIPLQVVQHNPASAQNIDRSIQLQQAIQNQADGTVSLGTMPMPKEKHKSQRRQRSFHFGLSSTGPHKGLLCCFCQCTQLTVGFCRNRFCGDSCCTNHEEKHCFRPSGNNECDCICCLIYLILLCCVWEATYNCLIAQICRKENRWCCVPCDLFVNLIIMIPLLFAAFVGDLICIFFATLACIVDPLCFIVTCNGEFCAWKFGYNALCCCTLGWYEDSVTDPKPGCWENECGDDCGYFYCYRLRCDNWNIC